MRGVIAFDTETALIRPGVTAPELACATWQRPGDPPAIAHWTTCHSLFRGWLESGNLLVAHNLAFDAAVAGANFPDLVPLIFDAYDADRMTCTMIRQKLLDIAGGCYRGHFGADDKWVKLNYSLFDLTRRHTGRILEKDEWRLTYGKWREVSLEDWPEGARTYPLDDARACLDVFLAQEEHASYLADQFRQARKSFWLHLASAWGLRTIPAAVERLKAETEALRDECQGRLVSAGLVRTDGTRDIKAAAVYMEKVCGGLALTVRRTEKGNVSLDGDACEATGDPILEDYAHFTTLGTILNKDVPALAQGCVFPIHTHFGLAETGRTTSSNPNVQNWGKKGGARECFTPRPGFVYAVGDVDQLELRTLAQVCIVKLGRSRLAEVLRLPAEGGGDPHTAFACNVLDISYERGLSLKDAADPAFDDVRQGCKFTNFALPGGVGPTKMVVIARSAGIDLGKGQGEGAELAKARELKAAWFEMWPEMRDYFRFIEGLQNPNTGLYDLVQLYTDRHRSGAKYTAAANSWFQGLGADGAGRAGWLIARAQYVDRSSPLFGCRTVNHSHDDFVCEVPDGPRAHDAAQELARLMVEGFGHYTPDVPIRVKPYLTRSWTKKAGAVYQDGRLIPWERAGTSNT